MLPLCRKKAIRKDTIIIPTTTTKPMASEKEKASLAAEMVWGDTDEGKEPPWLCARAVCTAWVVVPKELANLLTKRGMITAVITAVPMVPPSCCTVPIMPAASPR